MKFQKLVVIGLPHLLQNNDNPDMNNVKAISFDNV